MAPRRTGRRRPKRLEDRYEALAGDADERNVLYIFRRRLGMGVDDVRALPWYEKRLLLEGLYQEFRDPDAEDVEPVDVSTPEALAAWKAAQGMS